MKHRYLPATDQDKRRCLRQLESRESTSYSPIYPKASDLKGNTKLKGKVRDGAYKELTKLAAKIKIQ
ncbi:hypothetical protein PO124_08575 [Bacillus licheniformis]|nr:hypothetical protein [Bacillus licheniformis]